MLEVGDRVAVIPDEDEGIEPGEGTVRMVEGREVYVRMDVGGTFVFLGRQLRKL